MRPTGCWTARVKGATVDAKRTGSCHFFVRKRTANRQVFVPLAGRHRHAEGEASALPLIIPECRPASQRACAVTMRRKGRLEALFAACRPCWPGQRPGGPRGMGRPPPAGRPAGKETGRSSQARGPRRARQAAGETEEGGGWGIPQRMSYSDGSLGAWFRSSKG